MKMVFLNETQGIAGLSPQGRSAFQSYARYAELK